MSDMPLNVAPGNTSGDTAATPNAAGGHIVDVTVENFEVEVLQASTQVPVIVDFWAPWCGPCKTLIPALEKAVNALNGAVRLAKIDIDQNQMLAQQMRIQSVPTVYAFVNGQPVDGFQGALPESEITAFFDRVQQAAAQAGLAGDQTGPNPDDILAQADEVFNAGDLAGAAQLYTAVAGLAGEEGADPRALAGLARCHMATENLDQAQAMIDLIPEDKRAEPAVASAIAALELAQNDPGAEALTALEKAYLADTTNLQATYDYAEGLIGAGDMEAAADKLLDIVAVNRTWDEEAARKKLLTLFEALGPTDEVTLAARRRLSSILFS